MEVSLEERLKALDIAKEKIIHENYAEEQKKLEQELRNAFTRLKQNTKEEDGNENR